MSRQSLRRLVAPTLLLALGLSACSAEPVESDDNEPTVEETAEDEEPDDGAADDAADGDAEDDADAEAEDVAFPVTVTDDLGEVALEARPEAVVSLSPAATEMLFAIGAGDQVVAVDEFSTFPPEAPTTELSGFTPNVESVLGYDPDLVVIQYDPNDLVGALTEAGVPVLTLGSAGDVETALAQLTTLGTATGNDAAAVVDGIRADLEAFAADSDATAGLTYYHELSTDLYTATSSTFIGEIYGLFGLENIADAADADATGFPQLSKEYLVEQDPDYVFLACTVFCGVTATSFCERDGLGELSACTNGNVVELDDDIASRWGPRMVDFAAAVDDALAAG